MDREDINEYKKVDNISSIECHVTEMLRDKDRHMTIKTIIISKYLDNVTLYTILYDILFVYDSSKEKHGGGRYASYNFKSRKSFY